MKTFLSATTDLLPISGVTRCITLLRPRVTVPVWTVTRRRACVQLMRGTGAGEAGHGGVTVARHVEEVSDRDRETVLLLKVKTSTKHYSYL